MCLFCIHTVCVGVCVYVCVYMCMHLVMHVFFCVYLYHAHVSMGPLQFLSERSAVDRQSLGQFLALSPCFVCGIPGMCRNVGSDRWRGPPQRQTPPDTTPSCLFPHFLPLNSFHSPACSHSFKFSLAPCLKNECQETTLFFSLCRGEKEVDKLERKG